MTSDDAESWLNSGRGVPPRLSWSFTTDAPLQCLTLCRESGDVMAADASGGLYRLDRAGRIAALTRGKQPVRALAWSDAGQSGAALLGETTFCWFERPLKIRWSIELPDTALSLAVDAYGGHIAVASADCDNRIYNARRKLVAQFVTVRPLACLQFRMSTRGLVGAAEHGHLCAYDLKGREIWSEKLWSGVGDMCLAGDDREILLAGFAHGIQVMDGGGTSRRSYLVDGTVNRVSTSFDSSRIAAATVERHLYWLDSDGELVWACHAPDDVVRALCDPFGEWLICGFRSGRVVRLDWGTST